MNVFVFTDLHGNIQAFHNLIKQFDKTGDWMAFCLGDCADRGEFGYQILKECFADSRIQMLKGNHEDLFVKAARSLERYREYNGFSVAEMQKMLPEINQFNTAKLCIYDAFGYISHDVSLHLGNGGAPTLYSWIMDGMDMDFIQRIDDLECKAVYKTVDMCHAGAYQMYWDNNNVQELMWSRTHFYASWEKGRTLIHGHTPTCYLAEEPELHIKLVDRDDYVIYSENKIDIDTGACFTNTATAVNITNPKKMKFIQVKGSV